MPSSPPLQTDDPDTPGPGGIELNFPFMYDDAHRDGNTYSGGIDANLGIGERLQLRLQQNIIASRTAGSLPLNGNDQTALALKVRLWEKGNYKFAIYPSYQFNDEARTRSLDSSLLERQGSSFYLPLIFAERVGRLQLVENVGYTANLANSKKDILFTSVSVGYAPSDSLREMAEIASPKAVDEVRETVVRLGAVKVINPNSASTEERAIFGSIGQTLPFEQSGSTHTIFETGISPAWKAETSNDSR